MKGLLSLLIVLCLTAITQAQGVMSFVALLPEYKNDVEMPKVLPLVKESLTPEHFFALTSVVQNQKDFNAIENVYEKPVASKAIYYTDHGSGRPRLGRRFGSCSSSSGNYSSGGGGGGYGFFGLRNRPVRFRNLLPRNRY